MCTNDGTYENFMEDYGKLIQKKFPNNSPNREAAYLAVSSPVSEEMQVELAKKGKIPVLKDRGDILPCSEATERT